MAFLAGRLTFPVPSAYWASSLRQRDNLPHY
nr:MAG TPA: hypothetical protein [Caudoviricetes sp.]